MTLLPLEPIVFAALRRLRPFLGIGLWPACWRPLPGGPIVFTSFYLKDDQYILDNVHSLGPFVAAGALLA